MAASVTLVAGGILLLLLGVPILALALALYGAGNGIGSIAKGTLPLACSAPTATRRSWASWRCRACSPRPCPRRSGCPDRHRRTGCSARTSRRAGLPEPRLRRSAGRSLTTDPGRKVVTCPLLCPRRLWPERWPACDWTCGGRTRLPVRQGGSAIAREGWAVHQRQRAWRQRCERTDRRPSPGSGWSTGTGPRRRSPDRRCRPRSAPGHCQLGEQVAAQQGSGRLLMDDAGIPAVRSVRGIDVADPLAADVDHLAVCQHARRRSAMSFRDTRQPVIPCATCASGAMASHSFMAPHSSAS